MRSEARKDGAPHGRMIPCSSLPRAKSRLVSAERRTMMKVFRPPTEQLGEPSRLFREPAQSFLVQTSFVVKEAGEDDEGTHLV